MTRKELVERIEKLINQSNKEINGAICFLVTPEGEVGVGFFNVCDKHIDCFLPILEQGVRLIELHAGVHRKEELVPVKDESLN